MNDAPRIQADRYNIMNKLLLVAISVIAVSSFAFTQDKVEIFDKYVEAARKEWHVPGMSIYDHSSEHASSAQLSTSYAWIHIHVDRHSPPPRASCMR